MVRRTSLANHYSRYLWLFEFEPDAACVGGSFVAVACAGNDSGYTRSAITQADCVLCSCAHQKICITIAQLWFQTGEKAFLPAIPGNHDFNPGSGFAISVGDVNLE